MSELLDCRKRQQAVFVERIHHRDKGATEVERTNLLTQMQPCFGMIEVALDAAQNFVINDILIA
jgi:hypothetical protein